MTNGNLKMNIELTCLQHFLEFGVRIEIFLFLFLVGTSSASGSALPALLSAEFDLQSRNFPFLG